MLRQVIEASPTGDLAKLIATSSNRIVKGEFSQIIGRITCSAWTVPLWKDASKTKSDRFLVEEHFER